MRFPDEWLRVLAELAERYGVSDDEALEMGLEALRRMKECER